VAHGGMIAITLLCAWGCKRDTAESRDTKAPTGESAPAHTYSLEGVIRAIPAPVAEGQIVTILHQAIPDFRNVEGDVVGMMSMPMPFLLPDGFDLKSLNVGDAVKFTFVVDWKSKLPTQITSIETLPKDHKVDFQGTAAP